MAEGRVQPEQRHLQGQVAGVNPDIAQLARAHGLRYSRAQSEPSAERNSTLTRLKIDISLAGSYMEIRSFVHALETAPEFVVIDNVQLSEEEESGEGLALTLALSTFFRSAEQP